MFGRVSQRLSGSRFQELAYRGLVYPRGSPRFGRSLTESRRRQFRPRRGSGILRCAPNSPLLLRRAGLKPGQSRISRRLGRVFKFESRTRSRLALLGVLA